jgi:ATP-binding cassette subfamily B protein
MSLVLFMQSTITVKQVFAYALRHVKHFPIAVFVMLFTGVVWAVDIALRPYLIKLMLDRAAEVKSDFFMHIGDLIGLYLLMSLVMATTFRLYGYVVEVRMLPELRKRIASEATAQLLKKSHHYYQNQFSGALASKVNDLTRSIPNIVQIYVDRFQSHLLALLVAIYTLWTVNVYFALVMTIWSLSLIMLSYLFSKHIAVFANNWSELSSQLTGKVVDMLVNILSVRLFGRKLQEQKNLAAHFTKLVDAERKTKMKIILAVACYSYSFVLLMGLKTKP